MVKLGLLISKTDIRSRLSLVILVEFKIFVEAPSHPSLFSPPQA